MELEQHQAGYLCSFHIIFMLFTIKSSQTQQPSNQGATKDSTSMIKNPSKVRTRSIVHNIKLPNGCSYSGELLDGKFDGEGNLKYADNSHYEGTFVQGVKQGKGKYYYRSGELYIGDWVNNKKEGHGIYFYDKDKRYEGGFKNNMKHGKGIIYQTNGNLFEGEFLENHKNGQGTYYDALKERRTKLIFKMGELIQSTQMPSESALTSLKETQEPKDVNKDLMLEFLSGDSDRIISRIVSNYFEGKVKTNRSLLGSQADEANNIVSWHECQNPSQSEFIIQIYESPELQRDVPELRSENLRDKRINLWGVEQVCEWLEQIEFADFVTEFKFQKVEGLALLKLSSNDLIELGIANQSDRVVLSRQIKFLQLFFKSQCLKDKVSKLQNLKLDTNLFRLLAAENIKLGKQSAQKGSEKIKVLSKQRQYKQPKPERKRSKESKFETMNAIYENKQIGTDNQSSSSSLSDSDNDEDKQKLIDKPIQSITAEKKSKRKLKIQKKIDSLMKEKRISLSLIPREQILISKTIGKGSYGEVFLAEWMGQDIAVKRYMKKRGIRNRHIAHFLEEAEITNKLLHPNIVLFMGMFVYDNEYAMVMEYLSRGSLFDYLHIRGYKPVESKIISFCLDIAVGMVYLHGKCIIHCDLKSSNLLLNENWKVKISDFGLSQIIKVKQAKIKKAMKMGAPQWMAPEIMRGEKYEYASDVYSFGIVLWELMACQIPFREYTEKEIFEQVGKQSLVLEPPDYPNIGLVNLFKLCTTKESSGRPTFNEVVILLRSIKKQLQETRRNQ